MQVATTHNTPSNIFMKFSNYSLPLIFKKVFSIISSLILLYLSFLTFFLPITIKTELLKNYSQDGFNAIYSYIIPISYLFLVLGLCLTFEIKKCYLLKLCSILIFTCFFMVSIVKSFFGLLILTLLCNLTFGIVVNKLSIYLVEICNAASKILSCIISLFFFSLTLFLLRLEIFNDKNMESIRNLVLLITWIILFCDSLSFDVTTEDQELDIKPEVAIKKFKIFQKDAKKYFFIIFKNIYIGILYKSFSLDSFLGYNKVDKIYFIFIFLSISVLLSIINNNPQKDTLPYISVISFFALIVVSHLLLFYNSKSFYIAIALFILSLLTTLEIGKIFFVERKDWDLESVALNSVCIGINILTTFMLVPNIIIKNDPFVAITLGLVMIFILIRYFINIFNKNASQLKK